MASERASGTIVSAPAFSPKGLARSPPNLTTFTDTSGKGDDIFGQGTKELEPGEAGMCHGKRPRSKGRHCYTHREQVSRIPVRMPRRGKFSASDERRVFL